MTTSDVKVSCCCWYEIPYTGVSADNPAGHLLMALRNNKSVCRSPSRESLRPSDLGTDNRLMRGVLVILPMTVQLIPCVDSDTSSYPRQTLMQALRQTEPWFQRNWAAGMPGSIALARVQHLLAEDRHNRVYRFDPITAVWSTTVNGTGRSSGPFRRSPGSPILPHTPLRLIICTTDFNVYAFRMSKTKKSHFPIPNGSVRGCSAKTLVRQFVSSLTAAVARMRGASAMELSIQWASRRDWILPCMRLDIMGRTNRRADPVSMDLFNPEANVNEDTDGYLNGEDNHKVLFRPINANPVHPIHRLDQAWFSENECNASSSPTHQHHPIRTLQNENFSYCRTYPTRVPTVHFTEPLIRLRQSFQGFRFPVHSFHYCCSSKPTETTASSVHLFRAGAMNTQTSLHQYLHNASDTSSRSIHIRLIESPMAVVEYALESGAYANVIEQQQQSSTSTSTNPSANLPNPSNNSSTRSSNSTRWFVAHESEFEKTQPAEEPNAEPSYSYPSTKLAAPIITAIESTISWPTPNRKCLIDSWRRLNSLASLPQLHVPTADRELSMVKNLTASEGNLYDPPRLTEIASNRKGYFVESDASSKKQVLSSLSGLFRRAVGGSMSRTDGSRYSTIPSHSSDDLASIGSESSSQQPLFVTNVSLQRSLSSLAGDRGPHRSAWSKHMNDTQWLMLVLVCLRQAAHLASLTQELGVISRRSDSRLQQQRSADSSSHVVVTGPGSGRLWQPIITCLVQLILDPRTRSLAGFEDLIEREWVRLGYPFAPDPPDWFDQSVDTDYDEGASFGLFLDCVHQLMYQFPVEFAFTEDYLVVLLDTALSRGGGLPPLAIEFACSCEAARCVSTKAKSLAQIHDQSELLHRRGALRSFRQWSNVLTNHGLELFANWAYWCAKSPNPLQFHSPLNRLHSENIPHPELYPILHPPSQIRCWVLGWFRWIRSLRMTNGGGYAFEASFIRNLMSPMLRGCYNLRTEAPKTNVTPYTGWMSNEANRRAKELCNQSFEQTLSSLPLSTFVDIAMEWKTFIDLPD